MNNTEPPRQGPAPAGKPAWIYYPSEEHGHHLSNGANATMPYKWLPAPACPPKPPAEKTIEEKVEASLKWFGDAHHEPHSLYSIIRPDKGCIKEGCATKPTSVHAGEILSAEVIRLREKYASATSDERRRFARELLKIHRRPVQEMGKMLIDAVEEAAK